MHALPPPGGSAPSPPPIDPNPVYRCATCQDQGKVYVSPMMDGLSGTRVETHFPASFAPEGSKILPCPRCVKVVRNPWRNSDEAQEFYYVRSGPWYTY